jgi:hypothetical protein
LPSGSRCSRISQLILSPKLNGKVPNCTNFQEFLITIGTISAFGTFFNIVATPPMANGFNLPSFERVPSGKITVDQLFFLILSASLRISATACLLSFLSILAPPPYFRLNEMLGIPFVNSILEINLAWCFLRNQIRGGISYKL